MAQYRTRVDSRLDVDQAFNYLADFSHALEWDPSVVEATRLDDGPLGLGSSFSLVTRFGKRRVTLRYDLTIFEPSRRLEFRATLRGVRSVDTITFAPGTDGTAVTYDARLLTSGPWRLVDGVVNRKFQKIGADARAGLARVLNP